MVDILDSLRKKFIDLANVHWDIIINDAEKLESSLKDYQYTHCLPYIFALRLGIEENIVQEIQSLDKNQNNLNHSIELLSAKLEEKTGISHAYAQWSIESWCYALGLLKMKEEETVTNIVNEKEDKKIKTYNTPKNGSIRIATESKYYGIKGWLLFFSLFFIIVPVFMFIFSDKSNDTLLEKIIFYVNAILLILCGVTLLTKEPLAIKLVYYYCLFKAFDIFVMITLLKHGGRNSHYKEFIGNHLGIIFLDIIFTFILIVYFSKSKRIKATFGQYFGLNQNSTMNQFNFFVPVKVTEEEFDILNKDTVELEERLEQINHLKDEIESIADYVKSNQETQKNTTGSIINNSLEEKLAELKSLKEKNLISEEEYLNKRKEILSKY